MLLLTGTITLGGDLNYTILF